jgi:hypothetical protein
MFIIGIARCESLTSLSMSSFQMLAGCNGFHFDYIESFIFSIIGFGIL